ncbi:MAG: hypothetical protein V8Q27_00370 [Eubacteriales bacterium]
MMTADTSGSYCTLEPVGSERLGATYEGAQAEEGIYLSTGWIFRSPTRAMRPATWTTTTVLF